MVVAQRKYKHSIYDQQKKETKRKGFKPTQRSPKKKIRCMEKIQIVFGVVAIGALCIGILSGYVQLTESKYAINALNKEIEQLQTQVENLTVEVEGLKKSGWIEQKAKERLGMQYPLKEQMVFLNMTEYEETKLSDSHKRISSDNKRDENVETNKIKDLFKKVYAFVN